jgi:hypothetical protein
MTTTAHGLVPGNQSGGAALVTADLQYLFRDGPNDPQRERWYVTDAYQWVAGTSHADIVADAARIANESGGRLTFDRTGPGEVYADLFALAYRDGRLDLRPRGVILTSGQLPTDVGVPREVVVRRFEAKLASGRVVFAPSFTLREALREQMTRFAGGFVKRGITAADEEPNALLLALMLATLYRRFTPGAPVYVARNGQVYAYRSLSHDAY